MAGHLSITAEDLQKLGYPSTASLAHGLSWDIGFGCTRPNYWQYHLTRIIEVRTTINNILQAGSELAMLFGYPLGIRGFALKENLDTSVEGFAVNGILHPFENSYIVVLHFFLWNYGFTYQCRQLYPLLQAALPEHQNLWLVISRVVDVLYPPKIHLAPARWNPYPMTGTFLE